MAEELGGGSSPKSAARRSVARGRGSPPCQTAHDSMRAGGRCSSTEDDADHIAKPGYRRAYQKSRTNNRRALREGLGLATNLST